MKRVQWIWAGVCVAAIVIFGSVLENEEAQCRADHGLFCFEPATALGFVAVFGVVLWGVVALILWITSSALHWWARRR